MSEAGEFSRNPEARLWGHMTVEEIGDALKETQTAIIPTGCTEQHGYHLPILVDTITAYEVAVATSKATGCFALPPLHYSYSGGGLNGTVDLSPGLTAAVLTDIGGSLARQGVRNIIFVHGHCGTENVTAHQMAIPVLYNLAPEARLAVVPIYKLSETWQAAVREKDYHAGFIETSLILHLRPELVRDKPKWLVDTPEARAIPEQDAWAETVHKSENEYVVPLKRMKSHVKIGVWGDPSRSDPALGKKVFDECVAAMVKLVQDMEAGR